MANEFPADWKAYKLDELGFVGRGKSKHRPRNDPILYEGMYPFVQTGDVKAANFYLKDFSQTYNEIGLKQSKLWGKNTLCITIAANIAETAILDIEACFPDSIIGFVPDKSKTTSAYIKYYIDYIKLQMQQISQGTTQDNLSAEKLLSFNFIVPDITEQQNIVSILTSYDNLIENNNRRIAILEEMARSLYREWFVKFRFPGHEEVEMVDSELGQIPEGWEVAEINDFGEIVTGKTPSKLKEEYYGDEVPFIKTPDMHNGMYVINSGESLSKLGANSQKNKYLPRNSLLVSCIGTAGIVSINAYESQTNQQINSIKLTNEASLEFLYFALLDLKSTIENYGSSGVTMTNLSKGKFERLRIIRPYAELINIFHEKSSSLLKQILVLSKQNNNLKTQRDMLLPKLISGKIKAI